MYLSESCRTAINLEKLCRTLKSLAEICSCMRGNWCIWRQSVGCGEFGLKLVWWKCEWPLVGQLRILGLTAAVIYVRPVQKKTAVVLYNWYFKESITSVLQQKKIMPCIKNFARSLLRHGGHGQLYMRWSSSIFAKPLLWWWGQIAGSSSYSGDKSQKPTKGPPDANIRLTFE